MAAPLKTGLAPDLHLDGGYIIQFAAISPTDGSAVANVNVSNASLLVENLTGGDLTGGFATEAPLWLDLPSNLFQPTGGG